MHLSASLMARQPASWARTQQRRLARDQLTRHPGGARQHLLQLGHLPLQRGLADSEAGDNLQEPQRCLPVQGAEPLQQLQPLLHVSRGPASKLSMQC
jgi:hypothetical protein